MSVVAGAEVAGTLLRVVSVAPVVAIGGDVVVVVLTGAPQAVIPTRRANGKYAQRGEAIV